MVSGVANYPRTSLLPSKVSQSSVKWGFRFVGASIDELATMPRGYGYGAEPTFLYCGEYRVGKTYRFSAENVLNVKSKFSAFQNIQKF